MKKYNARKGKFITYLLLGLLLIPLTAFLVDSETIAHKPFIIIPLIIPFLLVLWVYLDTSYAIENNTFRYKSAFVKGAIDINSIVEIKRNKTMWVGLKPAMAKNGIIIKHGKYDEFYVAPESNDILISDLKSVNPSIIITD